MTEPARLRIVSACFQVGADFAQLGVSQSRVIEQTVEDQAQHPRAVDELDRFAHRNLGAQHSLEEGDAQIGRDAQETSQAVLEVGLYVTVGNEQPCGREGAVERIGLLRANIVGERSQQFLCLVGVRQVEHRPADPQS